MADSKDKKTGFVQEFKDFITKGNVLDMAVGIIIGIAFGAVINSMVSDLIMPPIGMLLGGVDFKDWYILLKNGQTGGPYPSLDSAVKDGAVTWRFGAFINIVINFIIVALVIFLIIKMVARMKRKEAAKEEAKAPTRTCPFCDTQISLKATRCPNCTSEVPPEKKEEPKVVKKGKEEKDEDEEEEDEEDEKEEVEEDGEDEK